MPLSPSPPLPQHFEASYGLVPWGVEALDLTVAGRDLRFLGLRCADARALREAFGHEKEARGAFEVRSARRVETRVWRLSLPEEPESWVDQSFDVALRHEVEALGLAGRGFVARLTFAPELAGDLWLAERGEAELLGAVQNYLRILMAYALVQEGGVLLHSAGLVIEGQGYLFFGPSGAGKSTLARTALEAGAEVLSDDLNAVYPGARGPELRKLPFTGDLDRAPSAHPPAPLVGLLRLLKGEGVEVRAWSRGTGLAALLASAPYVNVDPHRRSRLEACLEDLLESVPVGSLCWPKGVAFAAIFEALRGLGKRMGG